MTTTEPIRAITARDEPEDGRTARRNRNRSAVVDALLDLYHEGDLRPSADAIAERAGLSPRSLFRYFEDANDLSRAAIDRQQQRALPLLPIGAVAGDPLGERIAALVKQRVDLFEAVGVISVVSRLQAPFHPLIAEEITEARSYLRHQLVKIFAPELQAMEPSESMVALAALDVLCSFESYDLLRRDRGFDIDQTVDILQGALCAHLG